MKDHNRREMIEQAVTFYNKTLSKVASRHYGETLPDDVNFVAEEAVPATLVLAPSIPCLTKHLLMKGLKDIKFTKLEINVIDNSQDSSKFLDFIIDIISHTSFLP